MSNLPTDRPHITFLFSDTGGGHRAASEAIIESLHSEFGEAVVTEMVDFLKDYAPPCKSNDAPPMASDDSDY